MSKLVLNGDTSGSVTLDAPAVSGTTTLALPTTSGTVVVTSGAQTIEFADGSASTPSITNSGDTNTGMFFPAADTIAFAEGGAEAMRLDSSGNLGIGVTPNAGWASTAKAIQFGNPSVNSVTSSIATIAGNVNLTNDAYYDGTNWKYLDSYFATRYLSGDGIHTWSTAASGTAGNNITWSESMRIDSDGNVLVGTTTASGKTTILQSSNGLALNIGNESNIDGGYYGAVQITRPANQTGNAFHLAFVRNGNKIAGMGFLDNSNTLAIQNANDNTGAGVTLTNGATSWGTTSDERKKDIVGNVEDALSKIADWRCVYYKYKSDEEDTEQRVGLIAQDVQKTLPEAISIEEDELQTLQLRYTEVIPFLVKAIQEQQTIIESLKTDIAALKAKVGE